MEILVNLGMIVIIDDEDYDKISSYKWYAYKNKNTFYVSRHLYKDGKRTTQTMHNLITGFDQVDHVNGNGLDNRKENLRIATTQQNSFNASRKRLSKSKYKGVSYRSSTKKWFAQITKDYKVMHLGYFNNEVDAAKAYDEKALELFGGFAKLNFPI